MATWISHLLNSELVNPLFIPNESIVFILYLFLSLIGKWWRILHEQIDQMHWFFGHIRSGAVINSHQWENVGKCSNHFVRLLLFISFRKFLHNDKFQSHILFNSDELYWVHEMRLVFKASPKICNQHGHPTKPSKMGAIGKFIDVIFDTGFHRERLLTLLLEMVCWKKQL